MIALFVELSGVLRDKSTLDAVVAALRKVVKDANTEVEVRVPARGLIAVAFPGVYSESNHFCVAVFRVGRDGKAIRDYVGGGYATIKKADFSAVFGEV